MEVGAGEGFTIMQSSWVSFSALGQSPTVVTRLGVGWGEVGHLGILEASPRGWVPSHHGKDESTNPARGQGPAGARRYRNGLR